MPIKEIPLRQAFPNGLPWDNEPDRVAFCDGGIECRILRMTTGLGHLCGYARLPHHHPWLIGDLSDLDVGHGGITFGPAEIEGEPCGGLWVGFDCAHCGDLCPVDAARYGVREGLVYRDIAYVEAKTRALAAAIRADDTDEALFHRALGHLPDWAFARLGIEPKLV